MSEVGLTIGGRTYKVACADGEEAHLTHLGTMVDERLKGLGGNLSPQESQNLLFGALLIADELYETKTGAEDAIADAERQRAAIADKTDLANRAIEERDALRAQLSELEAKQGDGAKWEAECARLRETLDAANREKEDLRARQGELEGERDALRKKIAGKDALLDRADAQMAELKAETRRPASGNSPVSPEAELAPALERFADLLENCADKLEGKPAAS